MSVCGSERGQHPGISAGADQDQLHQAPDQDQLHQALFYKGDEDYLDGIMRFVGPALAAGGPVAAAVPPDKARLLRERLNGSAAKVKILDMFELGRNPARIIPAVEGMLAEQSGTRLHYVGEPIWPGRSEEEIREATKHESLINLAWPGAPISMLCPYDAVRLSPEVLADAMRTHPYLIEGGRRVPNGAYEGPTIPHGCDQPLPAPPPGAHVVRFGVDDLFRLRRVVGEVAQAAGLDSDRVADLMLVSSELSTNAIRHGHGAATLHVWTRPEAVVVQVEDRGQIADPLVGRRLPVPMAVGGLGLWMVNQLCDLVEVRTGEGGTTVRAQVTLGSAPRSRWAERRSGGSGRAAER